MTGEPPIDNLYGPIGPPPRAVRVRLLPWLLGIFITLGFAAGAYYWARAAGWLTPVDRVAKSWDTGNNGLGIKSKILYPAEPTPAVATADGRDLTREQLDALRRELAAQRALLEALRNQRTQAPAAQAKAAATPVKHRPMLFVANTVETDDTPEAVTYHSPPAPRSSRVSWRRRCTATCRATSRRRCGTMSMTRRRGRGSWCPKGPRSSARTGVLPWSSATSTCRPSA